MKIVVDSVSDKKTILQEEIPVKEWEMDSEDVAFLDSVHIDGDCFKIAGEIIVEAKVTTHKQVTCSRCLAPVRQDLTQDFSRSYSTEGMGEYLDLDQDIREEILLNFPMKALCVSVCKGICSGCGVNLNIDKCKC